MEEVINKSLRDYSKIRYNINTVLIYLLAFFVPTFLGFLLQEIFGTAKVVVNSSQIIVGSIVNTSLIIASFNIKGFKSIFGLITMPSLATICSGYIFSSISSIYMIYLIPAIWLGNFLLIYTLKYLYVYKKKNYLLSALTAIILKVFVIFSLFLILANLINIPSNISNALSIAMSLTQLLTASIGAIIAYLLNKVSK